MYEHILENELSKKFLENCGITISDESAHNCVKLVNSKTKEELHLWAEVESNYTAIPGIFIDVI